MTHQTNPDVIAAHNAHTSHVDDHVDNQATGPLTPASQPIVSTGTQRLDLDAWTAQRRADWQTWLADKLLATGYAARRVDGRQQFYLSELARQSGIERTTLLSWLQRGSQPSYAHVTRIASALGVQAIVVAYRAGLVGKRDLIALLNGGAIPTVESLHLMLDGAATMPDGAYRRTMEREAQRLLTLVETLQRELGWTDADFGPVAAEVAIRELADDPTPVDEHMAYVEPGDTAPRFPAYPGPTARYQAAYDERGDAWSRTPC